MTTTTDSRSSLPVINGSSPSAEPIQLSFPQPHAPGSRIHIHLTILATTILLFVTNGGGRGEGATTGAPLGSLVYAVPDRYDPSRPLSTTLYSNASSVDLAARLAKVLARRTGKAVHVGNSASFSNAAEGGTVEEEMDAFGRVVEVVMDEVRRAG